MANPMVKIVNAETGEEIEREMNAAELAQYKVDQKDYADKIAAEESKATSKAALLERLGITAEEATLLLS
jgi:hypothetical protein